MRKLAGRAGSDPSPAVLVQPMAELPSVITIESDTAPAIEVCEAHLHHLARLTPLNSS